MKTMSVQVLTQSITVTDRAAAELLNLITDQDKQGSALRVWVAGGGCSGLQYGLALDDSTPEESDLVISDKGVKIYIDDMSLQYMEGSTVDFVDDVLGGGFKIENPNATASCGCGSSFKTEGAGGGCGSGGCGSGGCGSR